MKGLAKIELRYKVYLRSKYILHVFPIISTLTDTYVRLCICTGSLGLENTGVTLIFTFCMCEIKYI